MERRVLLAIFLSFLVLYAYQALVVKPVPKPATSASGPPTAGTPATSPAARPEGAAIAGGTPQGSPSATGSTPTGAAAGQGLAAPPAPTTTPIIGAAEERDVRVETP